MSKTIIAICGRGVDPYWDFEGYTLLEFEVGYINADRRFFLSGEIFLNCNRTFIYHSLLKDFYNMCATVSEQPAETHKLPAQVDAYPPVK